MHQQNSKDQGQRQTEHKFSEYFYNSVTYAGVFIALSIFVVECFLFFIDFFMPHANEYLGIFTYLLLPPFLIFGLILIPVGALWNREKVRTGGKSYHPRSFHIDPSITTHRNAIFVFLVGTIVFIIMTGIGSYRAFHYTESVHFCGQVCHKVMIPEYTTYRKSPHARVKCVDCHIGSGADWYVRSKLSGIRQVFKTVLNTFPKPIPTPIHDLRPAKETCEQCHWPGKFFSAFELRQTYFSKVEENHPTWQLRMLVNVGRDERTDRGIHAHMYIDNQILYAAEDVGRQKITWVKSVDEDGREIVYATADSKYKDAGPSEEDIRVMDCMDCHNRPSHHYLAPNVLINRAMVEGKIDRGIPSIKTIAIGALSEKYTSRREAVETIQRKIVSYYEKEEAGYFDQRKEKIAKVAAQIADIYTGNFFPEMNARWDVYPDNIGHIVSPGCFRCHGGEHKSSEGKTIPRDCGVCHTIIEQGRPEALEKDADGLTFRHPFDEHDMWQEINCFVCHTGE